MPVDSFKYLPRLISLIYEDTHLEKELPVPWTPLGQPIHQSRFGLVTTSGLYHPGMEPPFDIEREKLEPTWGDPSYRTIPRTINQGDVRISHLHINNEPASIDINTVLPINCFQELEEKKQIGGLAEHHYSFMGFQGYPPDRTAWRERYVPEVAAKFLAEGVNCVLITPS